MPKLRSPADDVRRFWTRVDTAGPGGCWLWTGARFATGYGATRFDGKMQRAHRVSWLVHNSDVPGDLLVCHKCDVRTCVNPAHLFLGTHKDNARDMAAKGRHVGNRQLSDEQVRRIHEMRASGMTFVDIAPHFGVTRQAIGLVCRGQRLAKVSLKLVKGSA